MGRKTYCPGCTSLTSSLNEYFDNGWPCEVCGLSNEAWREILLIQRARNDDAMAERFTELRKENDMLIRQLEEMHRKFNALRQKVEAALK